MDFIIMNSYYEFITEKKNENSIFWIYDIELSEIWHMNSL